MLSCRSDTSNIHFTRIHNLLYSQKEASHKIMMGATKAIREFAETAAEMLKPPSDTTIAKQPSEDHNDKSEDYIYLRDKLNRRINRKKHTQQQQRVSYEVEGSMTTTLLHIVNEILSKDNNTNNELELCKLCLSSIISFTNPRISALFKNLLPQNLFQEAKSACESGKAKLACSVETISYIDTIVNGLLPFENDRNTNNCIAYIDHSKYKESDKDTEKYQLLCIIEKAIKAMTVIKKSNNPQEAFWVRKHMEIMEILFDDTEILVSDGESICKDTRAASSGSSFGRRVDILVSVGVGENAVNLASLEVKRKDATVTAQLYQQSKNHRINCGILNRNNCLMGITDLSCIYIDIVGPSGYIVQLKRHNDYYITQVLDNFHMPTELVEMDFLKKFLTMLYSWKALIVQQSIQLKKSLIVRKRKLSMIETIIDSQGNDNSSASSKDSILPIKIYHSP
ncbi:hypothetical protein BDF14DRAFT_1837198 [Spinellus fusiger]|nr:hypothetical protein BDF14DRAFT_1837198 [Spinellus fusiger]